MIDASSRLRRAIHLNDLVLVQRILKNDNTVLRNPDFSDSGNTSLHLAAKFGYQNIAEFLIDAGHEDDGISRNDNRDTPLTLAVKANEELAQSIAERFPRCIDWRNKQGADALMLAALHNAHSLLSYLLSLPTPLPQQLLCSADNDGNTALHYASANGQLKCIRTLLQAGADANAKNNYSWTPISYSSTVQAEVYFRTLVQELEKKKEEEESARRAREAGLRLVTSALERRGGGNDEGDMEDGRGAGNGSPSNINPAVSGIGAQRGFRGMRIRA
ncbi:hypothetical protein MMC25_008139, partial [Agyrium rufum]|nr:hypothetical protein [Agyrium rufum]